jgi:hypothetical protein
MALSKPRTPRKQPKPPIPPATLRKSTVMDVGGVSTTIMATFEIRDYLRESVQDPTKFAWAYSYGSPDDPYSEDLHFYLLEIGFDSHALTRRIPPQGRYMNMVMRPHLRNMMGEYYEVDADRETLQLPWGEYLKWRRFMKEAGWPDEAHIKIRWNTFKVDVLTFVRSPKHHP